MQEGDKIVVGDWLLHLETGVCDEVVAIWSGEEGDQFAGYEGKAINEPVIQFRSGHAFMPRDKSMVLKLTPSEVGFIAAIRKSLTTMVEMILKSAQGENIDDARARLILRSEFGQRARPNGT